MNKVEELEKIRRELYGFTESELTDYRNEKEYIPVMGEGSSDANIVFIGEAPGKNEAKSGKPFCGTAGKTLDSLLESIELKREDVYITNIVKDRPPKNRDPNPEEIALYGPLLGRELAIVSPKVVATLGRHAMGYVMRTFGLEDELELIGSAHGKVYEAEKFKVVPLYHPAAAIYNRQLIDTLKMDFEILKKFV